MRAGKNNRCTEDVVCFVKMFRSVSLKFLSFSRNGEATLFAFKLFLSQMLVQSCFGKYRLYRKDRGGERVESITVNIR